MLILLVGEYKTGKTVSACTFPKPMLYLDYNNGFLSVKTTRDRSGALVVDNQEEITVIPMYKDEVFPLDFTNDKTARGRTPEYVKVSHDLVGRFNKIVSDLAKDGCIEHDGKRIGPFKTLIIDSLTDVFRNWEEMILKMNGTSQLSIQDYRTLQSVLFGQFIPTMKALQSKVPFIILIDHEMMEKDELTGRIMQFPVGPSQNMGKMLGREFDEVWRMVVEPSGERAWKTSKDGLFQAGSRLNLPPSIKPPTFKTLEPYLPQEIKEKLKKGGNNNGTTN